MPLKEFNEIRRRALVASLHREQERKRTQGEHINDSDERLLREFNNSNTDGDDWADFPDDNEFDGEIYDEMNNEIDVESDDELDGEKPANINDVDDNSAELILENLELLDLMKVAETSKYYQMIAKNVYRKKFTDKEVIVHIRVELKNVDTYPDDIYVDDEIIEIRNPVHVFKIVRMFGSSIT